MATHVIESRPEFAGILRRSENFGTGEGKKLDDRLNNWFDRTLLQSGLELSPAMLLMFSVFLGITLGGVVWVIQENFLGSAFALMLGMAIPMLYVMWARSRRQKRIMDQLPEMVDELARAARTGRSIEQCFRLVADDTSDPLGYELRLCARRIDLGIPLKEALVDLPQRTGVVSLQILVMALSVHMSTGGDLVVVLERLAHTLRERLQYLGRLRAATAASRATAILMIVLPPCILGFFIFRDPTYLTTLLANPYGRGMTMMALALDLVGVIWVLRILHTSAQT